jgi:hypothetical protein
MNRPGAPGGYQQQSICFDHPLFPYYYDNWLLIIVMSIGWTDKLTGRDPDRPDQPSMNIISELLIASCIHCVPDLNRYL